MIFALLFTVALNSLATFQTMTAPAQKTAHKLGSLITDWVSVPAGPYTEGQGDTVRTIGYDFSVLKYKVTNAQYLQYLQEAVTAGEVTVSGRSGQGQYPGDAQWPAGVKEFYLLGTNSGPYKYGWINYSQGAFSLTPDTSYRSHPVVWVTWYGAWAFAKHYGLRLLTVEEWEKTARGNTGYNFPWGNTIAPGDANYWQSGDSFSEGTTPVGYYNGTAYGSFQTNNRPSPYGAYNMAGNAWEWTDSFKGGPAHDSSYRDLKGGAWNLNTDGLQSWIPNAGDPASRDYAVGFRCATSGLTSLGNSSDAVPYDFALFQNYPNPFNPTTAIRYSLPTRSHIVLTVFNMLGQEVAKLVNADMDAGYHEVHFDGRNLASGVYFYRMQAGGHVETKKLFLCK